MAAGWEPFVDRLLRTEKCEVYITGSSSRMLSREIATQMRGRAVPWELFPFSFREYLDWRGQRYGRPSSKTRTGIRKCFAEFWERGGFPEVRDASSRIRLMTHQEYFKTVIHRDIVERNDAAHPQAVLDASLRLINQVGSMFSVNALTDYLRSLGHKVTKSFVSDCVRWLEDAYFLFPVSIFHPSVSVQNANTRKVYGVDHALVRSVSNGILVNSGHLLEDLVFVHLRSMTDRIHYYRTRTGKEVDFAWSAGEGDWRLVQVCESLAADKTRKRERRALEEAMAELGIAAGTVVTRDDSETIETDRGRITVVPAWEYLTASSSSQS
jgi:predicted AAA+ superfamily ATPase